MIVKKFQHVSIFGLLILLISFLGAQTYTPTFQWMVMLEFNKIFIESLFAAPDLNLMVRLDIQLTSTKKPIVPIMLLHMHEVFVLSINMSLMLLLFVSYCRFGKK